MEEYPQSFGEKILNQFRLLGKEACRLWIVEKPDLNPNEGRLRRQYAWPLSEYNRLIKPSVPDDIKNLGP